MVVQAAFNIKLAAYMSSSGCGHIVDTIVHKRAEKDWFFAEKRAVQNFSLGLQPNLLQSRNFIYIFPSIPQYKNDSMASRIRAFCWHLQD